MFNKGKRATMPKTFGNNANSEAHMKIQTETTTETLKKNMMQKAKRNAFTVNMQQIQKQSQKHRNPQKQMQL